MCCCVPKKDLRQLTRIHKTQPDCINCKWERRERKKKKNEDWKWGQKLDYVITFSMPDAA